LNVLGRRSRSKLNAFRLPRHLDEITRCGNFRTHGENLRTALRRPVLRT
jgi:hypothetical protein